MKLHLDGNSLACEYEGVGAISAGLGLPFMEDYPDPYQSWLFDLVFKPNFGLGCNYLKIEIGGDINSSCGTEPAIMRTREEYERVCEALASDNPHDEQYKDVQGMFQRGYEFWFATEANKRVPGIPLDGLQWGAPAWVSEGKRILFTESNARFLIAFIKGAKVYWDLDFEFIAGAQNECKYDTDYIKMLRRLLDEEGLSHIKLIVADLLSSFYQMDLHRELTHDDELAECIHAIGSHYGVQIASFRGDSNKVKIWNGEDGFWEGGESVNTRAMVRPTIKSAIFMGHKLNSNYIDCKQTKTNIVNVVLAMGWHNTTPESGFITAHEPWSGHFRVTPMTWAVAHHTQFAKEGWHFLKYDGCGQLCKGGSYTTLKAPDSDDFSIIIDTYMAKEEQTITFDTVGLSDKAKHVWATYGDTDDTWFKEIDANLAPGASTFSITLKPNALYSITTTTGQFKGTDLLIDGKRLIDQIPPSAPLALPFAPDFSTLPINTNPPYFTDILGAFEVRKEEGSTYPHYLQQVITTADNVSWLDTMFEQGFISSEVLPKTVVGDYYWTDYRVSVDAKAPNSDNCLLICGRSICTFGEARGYFFQVNRDSSWSLYKNITHEDGERTVSLSIASGSLPADFDKQQWHRYSMECKGSEIKVLIDNQLIVTAKDTQYKQGVVGFGSDYSLANFANLLVESL